VTGYFKRTVGLMPSLVLVLAVLPAQAAEPPLLEAVYNGQHEVLQKLLAGGADVVVANEFGVTPLLQACRQGDVEAIRMLLAAGAQANTQFADGGTPLMRASASGSLAAVQLLLERGADVNVRERDQDQTALMWAAAKGHLPIVQALIAAGADVKAVARSNPLTKPGGVGGRNWADFSRGNLNALMFAVREGHEDVVRALLAAHADPNHRAPNGVSALMIAIDNDWLDIAGDLLAAGADVNDGSLNELVYVDVRRLNSVMHDASRPAPFHETQIKPLELMQRMLAAGADPNRVAHYTFNVSGADLAIEENRSAYAAALDAQDAEALRLFIATKRIDVNMAAAGGQPPLLATIGGGGFRFGGGATAATPNAYRFPGERGVLASARALLEAGANVQQANSKGEKAIHLAAQAGNLQLIELLARNGAQLDEPNGAGLRPVDLAAGKRARQPVDPRAAFVPPPPRPHPEAVALLQKLISSPAVALNSGKEGAR
jgi:uncharacterized protein